MSRLCKVTRAMPVADCRLRSVRSNSLEMSTAFKRRKVEIHFFPLARGSLRNRTGRSTSRRGLFDG